MARIVRRSHPNPRSHPPAEPTDDGAWAEQAGEAADGLAEETADETADASARELRPSRSQRKREALALQRLGVALTRLTTTQLAKITLPEELLEAVLEARRLRSRVALARQRQYIGRIMRQTDAAPIEQALQALNAKLTG